MDAKASSAASAAGAGVCGRFFLIAAGCCALLALAPVRTARGQTTTFTQAAAFAAALPGTPMTHDFDGLAAGTELPDGTVLGPITFRYALSGASLKVTDALETTSGPNSLGLTGGDEALLDTDRIELTFETPVRAVGLDVITSDPTVTNEIRLVTPVGIVGSGIAETTLPDGGIVYFVGLVSTTAFSTAELEFAPDAKINFTYNVDDVTLAVPEPPGGLAGPAGLVALLVLYELRSRRALLIR